MASEQSSDSVRDPARLAALRDAMLLDSAAEADFDRFTRLAAAVLGVPVALLSLVDADRQFFKSCVGLPEPWATTRQTPLSHSFCRHVVDARQPLIVEDARTHPLVRDNLAVPELGVVAYLGIPLITQSGHVLGSFCAIDTKPRRWSQRDVEIARDVASAAITEIELRAQTRLARRESAERSAVERRLRIEHAVTRVLADATDFADATAKMLDAVRDAYGWQLAAVWVVDHDAEVLRCEQMRAAPTFDAVVFDRISRETAMTRGVGLPGRVWESGKPAWVTDVQEDSNFPRRAEARAAGLHGAFCFPVIWNARVVGVMEFFTRGIEPPDEPLLSMLGSIGRQVGQFIERKRAETALRRSEARLGAVVEAALDCIVSMDHEGNVVEWNPAAERTFGYTRAEALGREMASLIIPPALREAHRAGLARYLASGEAVVLGKRLELAAVRRDSTEFPVELTITRVSAQGPPAFTGFLRDITSRKATDAERERLLASERAARADAERASSLKDEFLATVSHELRTPLNAILGYAQLLRHAKTVDGQVADGLEVIERNARVQTQIVEDLLEMSRIVAGKLRLDVQRVELPQVIEAALQTVRPAADAKGIRLVSVLDPSAGTVSGDPGRLQQVVWNVLSNAIKFTPKGGRVQVELSRVDSQAQVAVSDTGQGIDPAFLPYVFDKFRQADATAARKTGGLGLGLAIAKNIVEMHGGTIRATSAGDGQGSTFAINLPLAAVREAAPARVAGPVRPAPDDAPISLAGVTVLAVDDERDARELVRRVLQAFDARVVTAASGREALDVLARESVDVLLSDIGMPDMDGYDLLRRVRALPRELGGDVPAAALTAFARSEDRTRALIAGYQTHIAKPVEPVELAAAVASLARRTGRT